MANHLSTDLSNGLSSTNINTSARKYTVGTPSYVYDHMLVYWRRNRAICGGEKLSKTFDLANFPSDEQLLIPFSHSMSYQQYAFLVSEAELPTVCAQFIKMLIGGLLRKRPTLTLPPEVDEAVVGEAVNWLQGDFDEDGNSLSAFLQRALEEELVTSRAAVQVEWSDAQEKPFPVLHRAEDIINWRTDGVSSKLELVIIKSIEERPSDSGNDFDRLAHPFLINALYVHYLDYEGNGEFGNSADETTIYRVQKLVDSAGPCPAENLRDFRHIDFIAEGEAITPLIHGEPMNFIPIWALNGSNEPSVPVMSNLVDKEVGLYNKITRRNHLMYGAATYTPVIIGGLTEDEFGKIVASGLGSWMHLPEGCTIDTLKTPTEPLKDMSDAIAAGYEEMARLGVRMLSPENNTSGVAQQLRNASQTAQIGILNTVVSSTMADVIAFMLQWRYPQLEGLTRADIQFSMSDDFNVMPQGETWLRLATEWYEQGLIPRSVWITMLKQADVLPSEYNDSDALEEVLEDEFLQNPLNEGDIQGDGFGSAGNSFGSRRPPQLAAANKTKQAKARMVHDED